MTDWRREYLDLVKSLWSAHTIYVSNGTTAVCFDRHVWPVIRDARKKIRSAMKDDGVSAPLTRRITRRLRVGRFMFLIEKLQKVDRGSEVLDREVSEIMGLSSVCSFTTSIDAALLLIDREKYDYQVGNVNGHVGGTPFAQVGRHTCYASTPELALCAASLTALVEKDG